MRLCILSTLFWSCQWAHHWGISASLMCRILMAHASPPPSQVLTLLFLTCQWIICHNVHQGTRIGRWWRQLARTIVIKRAAAEAKDGHHKAFTIPLIRRGWEGINFQVYHCLKHTSTCSCLPWTRGEWWGNQHNSLRNFAWLQVRSWRGAAALKMGLVVYNAGILTDMDWCRGK